MIRQSVSNFLKYNKRLAKLEKNIIWIEQIERNQFPFYYSAPWDLVIGSFTEDSVYSVLNMVELEAMACEAPIIAHDTHEILLIPLEKIESVAFQIIEDRDFRSQYVRKNLEYLQKVHSIESVANEYQKYILNT